MGSRKLSSLAMLQSPCRDGVEVGKCWGPETLRESRGGGAEPATAALGTGWAVLRQGRGGCAPLGRDSRSGRPLVRTGRECPTGWLAASLLLGLQGPSPTAWHPHPLPGSWVPLGPQPLGWEGDLRSCFSGGPGPGPTEPRLALHIQAPCASSAQSWTPSLSRGPAAPSTAPKALGSPSESPPVLSARLEDTVSP